MRRHFWIKACGATAFMLAFFAAYFHVLRHAAQASVMMPLTALDHWVAFQPMALLPYASLWVYVTIPPMLLNGLRQVVIYSLWIGALCVGGLGLFYLWPTAVPLLVLDVAVYPAFAVLQGVDAAGNACPSLHVATAVFTAFWLDHLLRELEASSVMRWLNLAWVVLIVYSTLAIKQHVVLDVIAGGALALLFAWPSLRRKAPRYRESPTR